MEHQRRPLHRHRHGRHRHRRQRQLQPGHQVRVLRPEQHHRLPRHQAIYALNAVGPIPQELQNLTRLINLDLSKNYLTGSLPSFLGNLTAMQYMTLGTNALSGSVPKELGNLVNLVSLGFGSNYLNGPLPWELGNLAKLEQFHETLVADVGENKTFVDGDVGSVLVGGGVGGAFVGVPFSPYMCIATLLVILLLFHLFLPLLVVVPVTVTCIWTFSNKV
uniref:Uncharacterized protein n=1 Tax=Zea mays TaxID=4577 RepID=A0A804MAE6_MAIZE